MSDNTYKKILPDRNDPRTLRRQRLRDLKDRLFKGSMALGGISVIIAVMLIFFYLFYVVIPLFYPAEVKEKGRYDFNQVLNGSPLFLAMEEYGEIGISVDDAGHITFFHVDDGSVVSQQTLELGSRVASAGSSDPSKASFALGLANGSMILARHIYKISYPNDARLITPDLVFPLGEEPVEIDSDKKTLTHIAVQLNEEQITVAAVTDDGRLLLNRFLTDDSFEDEEEAEFEKETNNIDLGTLKVAKIRLDIDQDELYVLTDTGDLLYFNISDLEEPELLDRVAVAATGEKVSAMEFLNGGISMLVANDKGEISQWFPVADENNKNKLHEIRSFQLGNDPITAISPEYFRKGFIAGDTDGKIGVFYTTSQRTLLVKPISNHSIVQLAISPRGKKILMLDTQNQANILDVVNEHPEVSWYSIWGKVWYESRKQPEYIWQSSSASNDFEPKFSLMPLTVGTLKAAFYAMLFAVPLAIMGAVFTAYFMSPQMRNVVKPTIEIMEALPTVILGFLAGLWMAPLVEKNLPGIFMIIILTPVAVLLASFVWIKLPAHIRHRFPEGWEAALLVPVVIAVMFFAMALSHPVESLLFENDMPHWITTHLGLDFDQRNSLVVGIAMGFAVIPTIFSISEDAIFSVPKHMTVGSLALGATPWQTLVRVVILTASPGIFSALMIGLGRAVGETMIVLMATGNTPIMDFNIFQGFRALSANIAVEMPESEVASTHYRVLFLAALVLFLFTFVFNTIAEVVRQRLREKYSSL